MPKGKGTCPLAQSFWKDQVTTVCHVHPSLQLSAKEARGLLQQKRGEHDTPQRSKQLVTNGSEAGLVERARRHKKLVCGNGRRQS